MRTDRLPTMSAAGGGWVTTSTGARFYIQADAKTSPSVNYTRDGARADIHNAFPLPVGRPHVGGSCPLTTKACEGCYAAGSENLSPSLARNASGNLEQLRALYAAGGWRAVVDALVEIVEHSARQQAARGIARPVFRWHSGGDVFADWYARALVRAMRATPGVDHWLYTRNYRAARILAGAPRNARVYLSGDAYNIREVSQQARRYGLPVAMLADDQADAVALWARSNIGGNVERVRPVECPATGKYARDGLGPAHVVGPDGRRSTLKVGGPAVGACVTCGVCLPGGPARNVTFLLHGGKPGANGGRLGAAVRRRSIPVGVA